MIATFKKSVIASIFVVFTLLLAGCHDDDKTIDNHIIKVGTIAVSVITLFDGQLFTIIDGHIVNKMNKHNVTAMLVH